MDWAEWHDLYDVAPGLIARLRSVRRHITRGLDLAPPGEIRVVSICAGDGRDLIGALVDHPRLADVRARLVELDPALGERGRAAADAAGFADKVEFIIGDATARSAYRDFAPANLVLACGVFGNVRRSDTPRLIESLASLCARGGLLIWTRRMGGRLQRAHGRPGAGAHGADPSTLRTLLQQWSFEEVQVEPTPDARFLVATSRHCAHPRPLLPADERPLFVFTTDARDC